MTEALFAGVDHLAIAAREPATLADWYCATLGFRAVSDNGKERPTRLLAGSGGGMIEMMPDDETPPVPRELFNRGDATVVNAMKAYRDLTDRGRAAFRVAVDAWMEFECTHRLHRDDCVKRPANDQLPKTIGKGGDAGAHG